MSAEPRRFPAPARPEVTRATHRETPQDTAHRCREHHIPTYTGRSDPGRPEEEHLVPTPREPRSGLVAPMTGCP